MITLRVLPADGHHLDSFGYQGRRHVILRGERIGGAQGQLRPRIRQGEHQVGGLRRHVQTGAHPQAGQRPLGRELFPDG